MKGRLDMGLYWFRSVGSAPGFFKGGCNCHHFESGGTVPEVREEFIMFCDHGGNGWETGFEEGSGEGIKMTGSGFGFLVEISK